MINFENTETYGWEAAIRGMRNPMNSWEKSDTTFIDNQYTGHNIFRECFPYNFGDMYLGDIILGDNDKNLMIKLAKAGTVDAKFRRMITATVDITAPLYWWKEFDTYKVGTVANSCSTMHKIHAKEFTLDDFSCEHLGYLDLNGDRDPEEQNKDNHLADIVYGFYPIDILAATIEALNFYRKEFNETKDKYYWWQMIQLLPSSYNQKRTVQLNYEVLANIYRHRKDHKLDEWREFCEWINRLPYSEIITLEEE